MSELRIEGVPDPTPAPPDLPGILDAEPIFSARVRATRAGDKDLEPPVGDDDLVEIDFDEGVRLWTSVGDLKADAERSLTRAGEPASGVITIKPGFSLVAHPAQRGIVEQTIKALKFFRVDIPGEIADFIADKVEGQLDPKPGLYRCSLDPDPKRRLVPYEELKSTDPILVLIHGTGSTTTGSFGGLWDGGPGSRMAQLIKDHEGRVLALQHRSLSESPITNALYLATKLPNGARLRLVTHSRGGLVGELLGRGQGQGQAFDESDLKLFSGRKDQEALRDINKLLKEKQFSVERFVRVACPARGTTLAGRRLDRYLSVMVNALKLAGADANPVVDLVSTLLVGVVKKRTDPREIPGIEAMMPDSPLVRMLNRPDRQTAADLQIVAGDLEGTGAVGRLKELATNLFFREDHDLVVNTPAMFGGTPRAAGSKRFYWIDEGNRVDHFHYFRNPDTAGRIIDALHEPGRGFREMKDAVDYEDLVKRSEKHSEQVPMPVVIVVPGIMGSELKVDGKLHWMDIGQIARDGLAAIALKAANVTADGPLTRAYGELIVSLSFRNRVLPFGYDWRGSITDTADRLEKAVRKELVYAEENRQPVRILAHSMGGVVFRAMLATDKGLEAWSKACEHPGSRAVLMGVPSGGSHAIAAMLMGRDPLVSKLALLDLGASYAALLEIIAEFPGVLELLPAQADGRLDLLSGETWSDLFREDTGRERGLFGDGGESEKSSGVLWTEPDASALKAVRELRERIASVRYDAARTIYVAGKADATPSDIQIDRAARRGRRVKVKATANGDGRVPWKTGIPPELRGRTWYMDAVHGDLCNRPEFFDAISELLSLGTTTRLQQSPPPSARGEAAAEFDMPEPPVEMFPDQEDLVAAATGGSVRPKGQLRARVKVRVVNGDLKFANYAVMVGHYQDDSLFSAERSLDSVLQGRLAEYHRMGVYPGPADTAEVFLNRPAVSGSGSSFGEPHPGAVVVGLGEFGKLSPGGLTASVVRGAVLHASRALDEAAAGGRREDAGGTEVPREDAGGTEVPREDAGGTEVPLEDAGGTEVRVGLAPLLIGTSNTGGLTVTASLQCLLRGVVKANRKLQAQAPAELPAAGSAGAPVSNRTSLRARITEVEILELFEDRAVQALRSLRNLSRSAEFRDLLEIEPLLVEAAGRRRRAYYDDDPSYWSTIRIQQDDDDRLLIESLSDGARTEATVQPTQRRAVDAFIEGIKKDTATELGPSRTLFALLLPNEIKERARDGRDVLLMLDPKSAGYPWELLQDGQNLDGHPLAVDAGMLRRLSVDRYRERGTGTASVNEVLVVGNPELTDKRFKPLPGAEQEGNQVATMLGKRFRVASLIGSTATAGIVLQTLHERPYRLIHLAGHGVFQFPLAEPGGSGKGVPPPDPCKAEETVTGMVLGNGIFLTSVEIEGLQQVPEVVFINCCHLGDTHVEHLVRFDRLAANLATQFIKMGVRCVIAAGWPVDDGAALTFAKRFYEEFLEGTSFGESVKAARLETYLHHRSVNTWGAYQCYGDPNYCLEVGATREVAAVFPDPASRSELLLTLEDLIREAATAPRSELEALAARVQALESQLSASWQRSARVQELVGRAYAEVGRFKDAIERFDLALKLHPPDLELDVIDQRIVCRLRYARELADASVKDAADQLKPACAEVKSLLGIARTPRRLALEGGVHKVRAMLASQQAEVRKELEAMVDAYAEAVADPEKLFAYDQAALCWTRFDLLSARLMLELGEGAPDPISGQSERARRKIAKEMKQFEEAVRALREKPAGFGRTWLARAPAILAAVGSRKPDAAQALSEIAQGIRAGRESAASSKDLETAAEQVEFLIRVARTLGKGERVEEGLQPVLEALRVERP